MAYKKKELEKQSLAAIQKHNLFFIQDVVAFLPCNSATFYNHKLEQLETIKDALTENKVKVKNGLRAKWYSNGNATTQIALYKLLANDSELKKLNSQYVDHTTQGQKIGPLADWTDKQIDDELKRLNGKNSPIKGET